MFLLLAGVKGVCDDDDNGLQANTFSELEPQLYAGEDGEDAEWRGGGRRRKQEEEEEAAVVVVVVVFMF
jgi:hypothetical protein